MLENRRAKNVRVSTFGYAQEVNMKELGLSISTSLIERLNLALRHALALLVRKSQCFCNRTK